MTYKLQKSTRTDDNLIPNTWERLNPGEPNETIIFVCPRGLPLVIRAKPREESKNWQIAPDGKVTPSFACGEVSGMHPDCSGCHFHESLELEGYPGAEE